MYLPACLPIRVDIGGTGTGDRLRRFVGLPVDVGNLYFLSRLLSRLEWFVGLFVQVGNLGNHRKEEGGKHPEKISGRGHENEGTLLFIQNRIYMYFSF